MSSELTDGLLGEAVERAKARTKAKVRNWPEGHLVGIDGKPAKFHKAQQLVFDTKRRIVAMVGGSQTGKCLRGKIQLANGSRIDVEDMMPGDYVLSLDDNLKIVPNLVTAAYASGVQETYKVTSTSGRSLIVTAEHPLYSQDGWKPAGELLEGDFIGVPRQLPEMGTGNRSNSEMRLLGYMLGDGCTRNSTPRFTNADMAVLTDLASCLPPGLKLKHSRKYDYSITAGIRGNNQQSNFVRELCIDWGIWDTLAKHKRIPEFVFTLNNHCIAQLLKALYSCDGTVGKDGNIEICLASEGMIDDIQNLLLRFGIMSRKKYKLSRYDDEKTFDAWRLFVKDLPQVKIFQSKIGFVGEKEERLKLAIERIGEIRTNGKDVVPDFPRDECWDKLGQPGHTHAGGYEDKIGYGLLRATRNENVSRSFAQKLHAHFGMGEKEAYSDIFWDQIDTIEPLGPQPVYDITVEHGHNFIANDIFAHNTGLIPWWLEREIRLKGAGDYLAVTSSYDLFKLKFLPALLLVFQDILKIGRYWAGDQVIELKDPNTGKFWAEKSQDPMWGRIILRSAQSVGGLESATAKAAVLDEAGQGTFTIEAYRAVRRRLLLNQGRILITTTLYDHGWLVTEIINPARKQENTELLTMPNGAEIEYTDSEETDTCLVQPDSTVNPVFPQKEFDEAKASLPSDVFAMFFRGRVTRPRHMIYDCLDDDVHLEESFKIPNEWPRYLGMDFGGVNTVAIFVAEDPKDGTLYLYREYKEGNRTAEQHVENLMFGEPGRPVCYGGAKAEGQWRKEFRQAGLPIREPKVSDVWLGINRVYGVFNKKKPPKIRIFKDCTQTWSQLVSYHRKTDEMGNPTDDIAAKTTFHFADACRYLLASIVDEHSVMIATA